MDPSATDRMTKTLAAASRGEPSAAADLLPLVYEELLALARSRMAKLPPGNTLQPTALVHEAYLKLAGERDPGWDGRRHFFGAAARAMRQILVDQARSKGAAKRGGDRRRIQISVGEDASPIFDAPVEDVLALDEALEQLEQEDARKAQVVMLRFFVGMPHAQIAETLDVSLPTVERDWRFAKAWLMRRMELGEAAEDGGDG